MSSDDNKYTYWVFTIQCVKGHQLPGEQTMVKAMATLTEKYLFQLEKATSFHYQGCCKTRIRKRKQTLLNEIITTLDIPKAMVTLDPMQGTWEQAKAYCSKTETSVSEPFTNEVIYLGKDVTFLEEREKRFPWQSEVISIILDQTETSVKAADDRSILWIEDTKGGTGKSKLVKWLCLRNDNIIKVSFGTSTQLRAAIIAAGPRQVYFVDMPRTLGSDDSIHSLMSALEDLKNGFVVSSMYGKSQTLIMDPPHIIVFSNRECPMAMMSSDRWIRFVINKDKQLINLNNSVFPWVQ